MAACKVKVMKVNRGLYLVMNTRNPRKSFFKHGKAAAQKLARRLRAKCRR